MMNLRLVEETIKLVNQFYAAENIYENNSTLKNLSLNGTAIQILLM